jgi:hypothetical protein
MNVAPRPPASDIVVWGVPAALLLHNLEEGLTFARYLPRVRAAAPQAVRYLIPGPGRLSTAYVALVVVTVIPVGFALLARHPRSARWAGQALLVLAAILLVNVAWHLAAAVVLRGYAPGVATALAINLPVTVMALRRERRDGRLSRRGLWLVLLVGLGLHGLGLMAIVALVSLRS